MKRLGLWLFLLMALLPRAAWAEGAAVTVTEASVPVTINEQLVTDAGRRYPLLSYQGVTYLPLSDAECRFVGLAVSWSENRDTLILTKTDAAGVYQPAGGQPADIASAVIFGGKVSLEGAVCDNALTPYPILLVDGLPYLPLDWNHVAVDLHWNCHYAAERGLEIWTAPPQARLLTIKEKQPRDFVPWQDRLCYIASSELYSVDWATLEDKQVHLTALEAERLQLDLNDATLLLKRGPGRDVLMRLGPDGASQATPLAAGQMLYTAGNQLVLLDSLGQLYLVSPDGSRRQIGQEGFAYQAVPTDSQNLCVLADGDGLILLAREEKFAAPSLVRVGTTDGQTQVLARDLYVGRGSHYRVVQDDGWLYYVCQKAKGTAPTLYRQKAAGGPAESIPLPRPQALINGQFTVLGGHIYYQNNAPSPAFTVMSQSYPVGPLTPEQVAVNQQDYADWQTTVASDHELYLLDGLPVNPGATLKEIVRSDDYLLCTFDNTADPSAYQLMVLDRAGHSVYRDLKASANAALCGNRLVYTDAYQRVVCVDLP